MTGDTHSGFRLGDWQVYPLRNLLVGPPGEIHIEPKVMQVLVCLASHSGQVVERETLLNDIWDGRAFSDEPLTRCIAALRHALDDDPHDPQYIQTIPKSGYRLVCSVESLQQATNDATDDSGNRGRRRIALPALLGLILIAAVYVAYRFTFISPVESPQLTVEGTTQSEPPVHSIAVLPFVNLSSDPEQEYFSDGLSEELLNVLSRIPALRVVARTSSFQFKGENRDVVDIAQQLNVAFVLEGSVRKAGPQVRITTQLIDASNGFNLWSETYDRELENIFAVQDEISAAIVMALREHLGLQVEAAPQAIASANTEAHDAYLRGRYMVVQRTRATVEGAVREFEKAIALDPDYALAHAALAITIRLLVRDSYGDLTFTEATALATPHVERAMALDPILAEAHAATGWHLYLQGNREEALRYFRQAIQINPNYSNVYTWMANLLDDGLGRYDEAFAMEETALRLDPLSIPAISNYVLGLVERNRLDEADRELQKLASIAPGLYAQYRGVLTSLGGNWANAVLGSLDAVRVDPQSNAKDLLPQYFAIIGLEKEALAISEVPAPFALRMLGRPGDAVTTAKARIAKDPNHPRGHRDLGLALASAGNYARARPILEEMWQRSGGQISRLGLFGTDTSAALIAIRRDADDEAEIGELVAAIKDNVRGYREAGVVKFNLISTYSADYEEGLADYLAGDHEKGLALIAKAAEDGIFILPNEYYLQALYDDPGFAPIRAGQEARHARERERVLTIVCTDNPYAAVWQPAEGTCERFAAAGGN
jgi:TolB-like protein/DNA-binding winged helix-turn-helix (wHTH) protein